MPSNSVEVAVRCRPFNGREVAMNATLCIRMSGNTCYITNPENGQEKDFAFDYAYWSHDNYTHRDPADTASYMSPNPGSNYAD